LTADAPAALARPDRSVAPVGSFMLLLLRLILGAIFCLAAFLKLTDPQSFSEAIQAFKALDADEPVLTTTHNLPWVEIFAGVALILGFWTREAAFVIGVLLLVFIGVIISAIHKGLSGIPCSCFGYWHLVCQSGVGWCKVWENTALTAIAASLVVAGGGNLSLDRLIARRQALTP